MNTTATVSGQESREVKLEKFLENLPTEIDFSGLDLEEITTVEELEEMLEENDRFNIEIIYYYNAMEYLSENDPSLRESLELAHDQGCDLKNLNSEVLASILATENARTEFYNVIPDITDFLEELDN